MAKIKPEQYFFSTDGKVIRSIEELPRALAGMQNGAFHFHVNESKNDFAEWIKYVFKKKRLANKIRKANSKKQVVDILRQELIPKEIANKKGYFSELEDEIMKSKLPNDVLEEMKKYWKTV